MLGRGVTDNLQEQRQPRNWRSKDRRTACNLLNHRFAADAAPKKPQLVFR